MKMDIFLSITKKGCDSNATKIQLTSDMLSAKYNAIGMFNSQNNILGFSAFHYAFYRSDEFYWTYNYATMSNI